MIDTATSFGAGVILCYYVMKPTKAPKLSEMTRAISTDSIITCAALTDSHSSKLDSRQMQVISQSLSQIQFNMGKINRNSFTAGDLTFNITNDIMTTTKRE